MVVANNASPVLGETAFYSRNTFYGGFGGRGFLEGARGENLVLAGIRPRKPLASYQSRWLTITGCSEPGA